MGRSSKYLRGLKWRRNIASTAMDLILLCCPVFLLLAGNVPHGFETPARNRESGHSSDRPHCRESIAGSSQGTAFWRTVRVHQGTTRNESKATNEGQDQMRLRTMFCSSHGMSLHNFKLEQSLRATTPHSARLALVRWNEARRSALRRELEKSRYRQQFE